MDSEHGKALESHRRANHNQVIASTRRWVENVVIGLNLCPFARREFESERIVFTVSDATSEQDLLMDLAGSLGTLLEDSSVETTLLIHPAILEDFYDYNEFLTRVDQLLVQLDLEGVIQVASFHPQYQFADSAPDAVDNYSNRSPYPMLHLLREDSISRAVDSYPDIDAVPERNIARLQAMGETSVVALFNACRAPIDATSDP